jgi:hypothetical protein
MGQFHHFACDLGAPGLYAMAHPCDGRIIQVALYRPVLGIGRLYRLQLSVAQLGLRQLEHRHPHHRDCRRVSVSSKPPQGGASYGGNQFVCASDVELKSTARGKAEELIEIRGAGRSPRPLGAGMGEAE